MISPPLRATITQHRRTRRNLRRGHPLVLGLGLLLQVVAGAVSWMLVSHALTIAARGDADAAERRLYLIIFGALTGIVALTAIGMLGTALGKEQIALLLPMPLDPATRWRMMLTQNLLTIVSPVAVVGTTIALARAGWSWAVVFLLWLPAAVAIGILLALTLAWAFGGERLHVRQVAIGLGVWLGIDLVAFALLRNADFSRFPTPLLFIPDALLIATISFGPGAPILGRWYVGIARQMYATQSRSFRPLNPVIAWIGRRLAHRASPAVAVIVKEMRTQTRDPFVLLRLAIVAAAIPLAALLDGRLAAFLGTSDPDRIVPVLVIALIAYGMVEITPSPFGSEGNRLTIALLTQASPRSLIAGKATALVVPNLIEATAIFALLAWWHGISIGSTLVAFVAIAIAVTGCCVLLTELSAWDSDLTRRVDDRSQAILVEHMPIGARRMLALGVTLAAATGSALLIATQPCPLALPLLLAAHTITCILIGSRATRRLARSA
ncbi:MAG TPA: hypothetical protein VFQ54_06410 [Thermomicrobiales bacterium]|nr:hypothetical protein [Thermomicrobiales bacterium]